VINLFRLEILRGGGMGLVMEIYTGMGWVFLWGRDGDGDYLMEMGWEWGQFHLPCYSDLTICH